MFVSLILSTLLLGTTCVSSNDEPGNDSTDGVVVSHYSRPVGVMHVFFDTISPEQRFTAMTDEDDRALLQFWKQAWEMAGWEPRVLTLQDAKRHPLYESFQYDLETFHMDEFGKLSLLRWLAMAASGGGWLVDYDAFPLRDFRLESMLNNNGELTIYEAVAPILVSGSADAWLDTAKFLLEDAKRTSSSSSSSHPNQGKLTFWTDTLGLLNAWHHPNCTLHVEKQVLDGRKAIQDKPLTSDDCDKKPFRGKRVVHFGYWTMLEAPLSPYLRLPRHRLTVAKEWLPKWIATCNTTSSTPP